MTEKIIKIKEKIFKNNKNQKQAFRKWFVDMVYDNMDMEGEAVLNKREIMSRSKLQLDNLIQEGVYKQIVLPKKYYD